MADEDRGVSSADRALLRAAATGAGARMVSPDELVELARAAQATFATAQEQIEGMTMEQAAFVRRLRCDDENGYTWRAVAETCHLEWCGVWEPPSNQLWGMAICKRAAELHGEDYMGEPWN